MNCSLCHDTGWLIEAKDRADKVALELIPCLIPDCDKSGQVIELMSIDYMRLAHANWHPSHDFIMSVSK